MNKGVRGRARNPSARKVDAEDEESKVIFGCIVSLRLAWAI